MHMARSEDSLGSWFSPATVSQALRLGGKYLYSLSLTVLRNGEEDERGQRYFIYSI